MQTAYIFDLDNTISINSEFYRTVYSQSLTDLIAEARGEEGLQMLEYYRRNCNGKGELALFALNLPFSAWAERLIRSDISMLEPSFEILESVRSLRGRKIVYTGSPRGMADAILMQIGFHVSDFDLVLGWEKPEVFPTKWTCSPTIFRSILMQFGCNSQYSWSIGDNWDTDIVPARTIGINTAFIDPDIGTKTREAYTSLPEFVRVYHKGGDRYGIPICGIG